MATTPGTLQEFDMVLSLSEAALNDQFLLLYRTPVRSPNAPNPLPPIPGQPIPLKAETDYLISHKFSLKVKGGKSISGYIECPRIDMVNLGQTANKGRTVKLDFKFLTNAEGYEGDEEKGIPAYDPAYDSKLVYWTSETVDDPPTIRKELELNGYMFSFEASLGKKDIHEIQKEQEQYLHPETYKALMEGISNNALLPSSIFCLFQSAQIANTFIMCYPSGQPVTDKDMIGEFLVLLTQKFKPEKPGSEGLPSKNNSFILGYGISQKVPQSSNTSLFLPKNFQFSITKSKLPGLSTLNFLMLTEGITAKSNVEDNPNAGFFSIGPFEIAKATNSSVEGIMSISSNIFLHKYLASDLAKIAWLSGSIPSNWTARGTDVKVSTDTISVTHCDGRKLILEQRWWTSEVHWTDILVLELKESWAGTSKIEVTWDSIPKLEDSTIAPDAKRQVRLEIKETASVTYKRHNERGMPLIESTLTVPLTRFMLISTGADGKWNIREDATQKITPPTYTDIFGKQRIVIAKFKGDLGIFPEIKIFGSGIPVNQLFLYYIFEPILAQFGIKLNDERFDEILQKQLNALDTSSFNQISERIVMPAGEVISFNGISADANGHLYSLIKYKTITGGNKVE